MGILTVPSPQYPTIQAAINAANPYDTVAVVGGYSNESVTVTKNYLTITGPATSTGIELTLGFGINYLTLEGDTPFTLIGRNETLNSLTGNAGNNTLKGGTGNDLLIGGPGADRLDGGLGSDTAGYAGATVGVTANLAAPSSNTGDAAGDLYISIENLTGSSFADVLIGDDGANTLDGGGGVSFQGDGKADRLEGGGGSDTYVVRDATDIVIEVSNGGTDRVITTLRSYTLPSNVEGLVFSFIGSYVPEGRVGIGNALDNSLSAGSGAVRLFGLAGNDSLYGSPVNDILDGGMGDDVLNGGDGVDMAVFAGPRRHYAIGGDASTRTVSGPEGRDTLRGVEDLAFVDGRLTFDVADSFAVAYRLYDTAFNRAPDTLGVNTWAARLEAGTLLSDVATGFSASAEFQATYGSLTNRGFVAQLYRNVLDREADGPGLAHWTGLLDSGSQTRGQVLAGFSESAEHINLLRPAVEAGLWDQNEAALSVARLYYATLDRAPDAGGLANWTRAVEGGTPLVQIAGGFTNSAEFQAAYGALDDGAFVDLLYRNVLGREADAGGRANWLSTLTQTGRESVVLGFSESLEFQISTQPLMEDGIRLA